MDDSDPKRAVVLDVPAEFVAIVDIEFTANSGQEYPLDFPKHYSRSRLSHCVYTR